MRGKEIGGSRDYGWGSIAIPEQLLDQLARISEPALRAVLYLHLAQFRAGVVGVPVPIGELARKSGFSEERTLEALSQLASSRWVEHVPDTDCWRLLPPRLVE